MNKLAEELEQRLNTECAAQRLGTTRGHLANLRARGLGPRYLRHGDRGQVWYLPSDLDDWLLSQRREPNGQLVAEAQADA